MTHLPHLSGPFERFNGLIGGTPLARLHSLSSRRDITLYAKLEGTNLGGSVKDRAAFGMISVQRELCVLVATRRSDKRKHWDRTGDDRIA